MLDRPSMHLPPALADALAPHAESIKREMRQEIEAALPGYRDPVNELFSQGLHLGLSAALEQLLAEIASGQPARERRIFFQLGRGQVMAGQPLDELLSSYRIGGRVLVRRAGVIAREADFDSETLSLLTEAVFALIDEYSRRSAEGYAKEQTVAVTARQLSRHQLVRLILRGSETETIEATAKSLGWSVPSRLSAVVVALSAWEDISGLAPDCVLAGPYEDLICLLVPADTRPVWRRDLERLISAKTLAVLGPELALAEAPLSFKRAADAFRVLHRVDRPPGLIEANSVLAELVLLSADRHLVQDLIVKRLGPLDQLPGQTSERLRTTLLVWLENECRIESTARALFVHSQTVRHRLGRLRDVYGEQLDRSEFRDDLRLALRLQQLLTDHST